MLTSDQRITPNLWFDDQAEAAAPSAGTSSTLDPRRRPT